MSDQSRVEQLLRNALGEDVYEVTPQSRVEELLVQLNELIEGISASVDPEELTSIVTAWLAENIHDGAVVDTSLSVAGAAAESKKTGDEISQLKEEFTALAIELEPIDIISGIACNGTRVTERDGFATYVYELSEEISNYHAETRYYGNVAIIASNETTPQVLTDKSFYTWSAIETQEANVSADISYNGFKYLLVPVYGTSVVPLLVGYRASDYVNKGGTAQINKRNTTFYKQVNNPNLFDVNDGTYTDNNCEVTVSDNIISIRKTADITTRPVVLLNKNIFLEAGTYAMYALTEDSVIAYNNPFFVALYKGNISVQRPSSFQTYAWCAMPYFLRTFTLTEDGTYAIGISEQNNNDANALLNDLGSLTVRVMLCKGSTAQDWFNPKNNYYLDGIESIDTAKVYPTVAMFEKMAVIGDSFASGQLYLSGSPVNYYNLSWGQVMARRNGIHCINMSRGGLTTKTWLTDSMGLPLLNSSDPQGLYIVALGLNDISAINNDGYQLGTTADFDLDNYASTPDTFYGNMCKIIGNILAKSPHAKIVLSQMATDTSDTRRNIRKAVADCAELAGVALIDQLSSDFFVSDYYTNGMVGAHPTAPVYSGMATAIEELINKCMANNYDYFYDFSWTENQ